MKKVVFVILFLSSFNLFGQGNIRFEVDLGAAIPMHEDLKNIFDSGFDLNAGFSFNVLRKNLYLKPTGGVQWYSKKLEYGYPYPVTEHLRTWKAGLEMHYYCLKKGQWMLAPFVKVDHNWSSNYLSESHQDPLHPYQNPSPAAFDYYLEGKGFSFAFGSIVSFHKFYFKINYEVFSPTLNVNQDIIDAAFVGGFNVDPTATFNLNSLNLSIGYAFEVKK